MFELLYVSEGQGKEVCLLHCQLCVKISIVNNETSLLPGCNYCQLFENMHWNMSTFCIFICWTVILNSTLGIFSFT